MLHFPETFVRLIKENLDASDAERMRRVCRLWDTVFVRAVSAVSVFNIALFDGFIDVTLEGKERQLRFMCDEAAVNRYAIYPLRSLLSFARYIVSVETVMAGLDSSFNALSRMDANLRMLKRMGCSEWRVKELGIWLVDDLRGAQSQLSVIPLFADRVTAISLLAQKSLQDGCSLSVISKLEKNRTLSRLINSITNLKAITLSAHLIQERIPRTFVNSCRRVDELQIALTGDQHFERRKPLVDYCLPIHFRLSGLLHASLQRFDLIVAEESFSSFSFGGNSEEIIQYLIRSLRTSIFVTEGILCSFSGSYVLRICHRKFTVLINPPL
ncbi:hypothetical protein Tcan_14620 [Toxocara canis]|uniref:F-box domain-containing protein n=1 Tax=Toxocara canis TaxID=6265 RepID=A0A0B2VHP1_TOXCA|nr:hypothetical protein Tcan_14620 [Toxocara canis]